MLAIDEPSTCTNTKRKAKKLSLLKTQINIRKKVLKQNIRIPFSRARKQRPLIEIVNNLGLSLIVYNPLELVERFQDPNTLAGKRIRHKFVVAEANTVEWYCGTENDYDALEKKHEIQYDDEAELCKFDLVLDFLKTET